MAQFNFRLNVTPSAFPFLSDQIGATVITGQQDTYYARPNAFSGETADKNLGIPQMFFCENVMPVSYGLQSVGFLPNTLQFTDEITARIDQLEYIFSQNGKRYMLNFDRQSGFIHVFSPETGAWIKIGQVPTVGYPVLLTVAHVQGRAFFYIRGISILWEFRGFVSILNTFSVVELFPTAIDDFGVMQGIVSANNYLIAYTDKEIFYTIVDPTAYSEVDFTPSLGPTGAASEAPSALRGLIVLCKPTQDGFIIYTQTTEIAAYYSNNIRFPWSYRELENSAPIVSVENVACDREGYGKFIYTTGGVLKLGKSVCTPVFPEISEFFGAGFFERYDWSIRQIVKVPLTGSPLNTAFAFVGNRWLVISYGLSGTVYSHALIWDDHLRRWGKVVIDHTRAFEFYGISAQSQVDVGVTYQDLIDANISYQYLLDQGITYADLGGSGFIGNPDAGLEYNSIGFAAPNGIIYTVCFDQTVFTDRAVAIIGRIQLTRNHRWNITDIWSQKLNNTTRGRQRDFVPTADQLVRVTEGDETRITEDGSTRIIDLILEDTNTHLQVLTSEDLANTFATDNGFVASNTEGMVHHLFSRAEGANHCLKYEGDFDLSTIIVRANPTGRV